jgi:hypothetical protein
MVSYLGLNEEASRINTSLKEHFGFKDEIDMFMFAFAYAVTKDLKPVPVSFLTKWGIPDNVDVSGLVHVLYPNETDEPNKLCNYLAHAGIYEINTLVGRDHHILISNLVSK